MRPLRPGLLWGGAQPSLAWGVSPDGRLAHQPDEAAVRGRRETRVCPPCGGRRGQCQFKHWGSARRVCAHLEEVAARQQETAVLAHLPGARRRGTGGGHCEAGVTPCPPDPACRPSDRQARVRVTTDPACLPSDGRVTCMLDPACLSSDLLCVALGEPLSRRLVALRASTDPVTCLPDPRERARCKRRAPCGRHAARELRPRRPHAPIPTRCA